MNLGLILIIFIIHCNSYLVNAHIEPECGTYNPAYSMVDKIHNDRIIFGHEIGADKYPWYAYIRVKLITIKPPIEYTDSKDCGGSLISKKHVLTAAHCLIFSDENSFKLSGKVEIFLGVSFAHPRKGIPACKNHDASALYPTEKFEGKRWVIHEKYAKMPKVYDIGIILLDAEACRMPICQWSIKLGPLDLSKSFTIIGFGALTTLGIGPDNIAAEPCNLVEGQVSVYTQQQCNSSLITNSKGVTKNVSVTDLLSMYGFGSSSDERENTFCAGEKTNVCKGDSGGPLMVKGADNKMYLVGITSGGYPNKNWANYKCSYYQESIFTNVTTFGNWIDKTMKSLQEPVTSGGLLGCTANYYWQKTKNNLYWFGQVWLKIA